MWLMPNVGLLDALGQLLAGPYDAAEVLLFTSAHDPAPDDDLSVYEAIEASWTGYARQVAGPWDAPLIDGDGRAFSYSAALDYTVTAVPPGTLVYGYALALSSVLLWAERLVIMPVPSAGNPLTLRARIFVGNVSPA